MIRVLIVLLLGGRATSVPRGPATLVDVTLYRDVVTARMSDGSLCVGLIEGNAWNGAFAGCPHLWPVQVLRGPNVPRAPLVSASGDPWVVIETPSGPRGFAPPS